MLCALAVAFGVVEPAILDRVPITPALLEGRWKTVWYTHKLNVVINTVYRKDGTYVFEQFDRQTGEKKTAWTWSGTYTVHGRRMTCKLQGSGYEPTFDVKLLPGGRMRLASVGDRDNVSIMEKVADR